MLKNDEERDGREGLVSMLGNLSTWAKIVVALAPITFAAGGAWVGLSYRVTATEKGLAHLETVAIQQQEKIDSAKEHVRDMAKDLEYIKEAIDKNEKVNEEILRLLRKKD